VSLVQQQLVVVEDQTTFNYYWCQFDHFRM